MSLHPALRFSDPRAFAERSIRAHGIALAGGATSDLDTRVLQAWRRSGAAGISPDQELPTRVLTREQVADARGRTPLRHIAADVVASVSDTSVAGRHLAVLTDARGCLLWRSGSPEVLRRADAIAFAEGADWSERGIGTNGISLALETGTLTHATAGEHYVRAHHGWTCTASPVRDAGGRILGVLDVSHPVRFSSSETAALVRCGVRLAETLLASGAGGPGTGAPVTEIRLLGWRPSVIRADGSSVDLTPRRAELLALLASGRRGRRGPCPRRSTATATPRPRSAGRYADSVSSPACRSTPSRTPWPRTRGDAWTTSRWSILTISCPIRISRPSSTCGTGSDATGLTPRACRRRSDAGRTPPGRRDRSGVRPGWHNLQT